MFFLVCNDTRLLPTPIRSRCVAFFFAPLDDDAMLSVVAEFCTTHALQLSSKSVSVLLSHCRGDLRVLTGLLEHTFAMFRASRLYATPDEWLLAAIRPIPPELVSTLFSRLVRAGDDAQQQQQQRQTDDDDDGGSIAGGIVRCAWDVIDTILDRVYDPSVFLERLFEEAWKRDGGSGGSSSNSPAGHGVETRNAIVVETAEYWNRVCTAMLQARQAMRRGCDASLQLYRVLYVIFGSF